MAGLFEMEGPIGVVTLDSPAKLNALSLEDLEALAEIWSKVESDRECYVVIVTGTGSRAFCSGADLGALIPLITGEVTGGSNARQALASMEFIERAFLKRPLSKPIVAAVNGYCIAGGLELLQATDIRLAVPEAFFSLQEPRWGLFPAGGSTVRLPRQIPFTHAMDILLTGRMLSADEALKVGLIGRVVDSSSLLSEARIVASQIAENGPLAVQAIKRSVLACLGRPESEAFALELEFAAGVFASRDAREGPAAFMAKRKPVFRNE